MKLSKAQKREFVKIAREVMHSGRYREMKKYYSHSDVTVYTHCVKVAYAAYSFAVKHGIRCDLKALVRGALLHDYYLYDWHDPNKGFRWHGFKHHRFALRNAEQDYPILRREREIIRSHMFPLTFWCVPKCREAWIVSIADKIVASEETLRKYKKTSEKERVE